LPDVAADLSLSAVEGLRVDRDTFVHRVGTPREKLSRIIMTRQAPKYIGDESGASVQRWLMTIPEYAVRCSVCSRTVQNWIRWKAIPILKLGRSVRIDPQRADQALRKFEVREAGARRGRFE